MKIAVKLSAWIVGVSLCCALAVAKAHPEKVMKVKIEATELDRKTLLLKLNKHGRDTDPASYDKLPYKMKFEQVEVDYDYRIVFATGQGMSDFTLRGSGGSINTSGASADVFDSKGTELFRFERNQRGTDEGATNAVAEEIIKRILKLNKLNSRHD